MKLVIKNPLFKVSSHFELIQQPYKGLLVLESGVETLTPLLLLCAPVVWKSLIPLHAIVEDSSHTGKGCTEDVKGTPLQTLALRLCWRWDWKQTGHTENVAVAHNTAEIQATLQTKAAWETAVIYAGPSVVQDNTKVTHNWKSTQLA